MWVNPLSEFTTEPQNRYPPSNNWTPTGNDKGPSITDSFFGSDANSNYPNPSVFYINPCVAEAFEGGQKQFPVYSFIGSPYFSTSGNANSSNVLQSSQNTDPSNWMLYYQMSLSNICGSTTPPAPISGNIGFPIVYNITGTGAFYNFLFFQVIFVLPLYGGQYITNAEVSSSKFAGWIQNSVPTFPGYLLAFYKRLPAQCQSAPCPYEQTNTISDDNLKQSPYNKNTNDPGQLNTSYGFGNYFPVIYEATNMKEQNSGKLPDSASLLYLLNKIATTGKPSASSYTNVHDALSGLGWLEYTTNNNGVSFGNVQTVDGAKVNLGDNWYFGGYVPFNFSSTTNKQTWSSSINKVATVALSTNSTYGTIDGWTPFMDNHVIMATTVPLDASGNPHQYYAADPSSDTNVAIPNTFWKTLKTNTVPPIDGNADRYYKVAAVISGGYFQSVQALDSPVPYINVGLTDPYKGGNLHLVCNIYNSCGDTQIPPLYNGVEFQLTWAKGVNGVIPMNIEVFNWSFFSMKIKIINGNGTFTVHNICGGYYTEYYSNTTNKAWEDKIGGKSIRPLSNNQKQDKCSDTPCCEPPDVN